MHVLRGEPARAVLLLDRVLADVRESRWTAFAPFPLSLRAESAIDEGDTDLARDLLDHAWVLATESGNQCWISAVAHAQAVLAERSAPRSDDWSRIGLAATPWYAWLRARMLDLSARLAGETPRGDGPRR